MNTRGKVAATVVSVALVFAGVPAWADGFATDGDTPFTGDEVGLPATSGRTLQGIKVVMSSWACQTGNVSDGTCTTTTPRASFTVPITVNLYAVAGTATAPVPGVALAAKTQSFNILYRPTSTPDLCSGDNQRWFDFTDGTCDHGLAQVINFSFAGKLTLPSQVIWTVAFNTTHLGASPVSRPSTPGPTTSRGSAEHSGGT